MPLQYAPSSAGKVRCTVHAQAGKGDFLIFRNDFREVQAMRPQKLEIIFCRSGNNVGYHMSGEW